MTLQTGGERAVLEGMVDRQRAEIARLLDGLSEEEARARLVPSLTTPLGLVAHATFVERVWFHHRVAGVPRAELGLPETVEESFVLGDDDTVASVRAAYDVACARSREIAAGHDLDKTWDWHGGEVSLRFVLTHLVQELARHAGHGDILVEQLVARRGTDRPEIVCLCGSTRFATELRRAAWDLTSAGAIVLSPEDPGSTAVPVSAEQKRALDVLHRHKIDLADRVLVVNPDGYVGKSTRAEIDYARSTGTPVSFTDG